MSIKKAAVLLSLVLFSGPLAGCLEGQEAPITYGSSAQCSVSWHVAFFDLSADTFSEWGGEVTFYASDGSTDTIRDFSAEKQFVLLDPTLNWSMEYTFFEEDVGFMNGETMYGGDNEYGDTGRIDIALMVQTVDFGGSDEYNEGEGVTYSHCAPDDYHVEFFDRSAFDFCCWDGEVEFISETGGQSTLESFSSAAKFVVLEEGHVWTMHYAFYESDIGFIVDGKEYGGNNENGDSGSITIDLT